MAKITPNKLQKLISKGRLIPVLATNNDGKQVLLGYKRKNKRSSKSHEQYMFAEPMVLDKTVDKGI